MSSRGENFAVTFNLSKIQFIFALLAHAVVILSAALWIGRVLVQQEFQLQLEIFHAHAKPQIEEMVDAKILGYSTGTLTTRQTDSSRLATLEEHARSTDVQLGRIENKVDRLLERR